MILMAANKIYSAGQVFTYKTVKWQGVRKVVVRDSKGRFVSISKWRKEKGYSKLNALMKVIDKTGRGAVVRKRDEVPERVEEVDQDGDQWEVVFQNSYNSKTSGKDISFEASGIFDYKPDPKLTKDYIQKSFTGSFTAVPGKDGIYANDNIRNPRAHHVPFKLFRELVDSNLVITGVQIRKVKDRSVTNSIHAQLKFKSTYKEKKEIEE